MRSFVPATLLSITCLAVLAGCPDKPSESQPGEGTSGDASEPTRAQPAPATLELQARLPLLDGGTAIVPIEPGEQPEIDPASSLEVTSNLPLKNYRVRLFDEVDRAMVSDDVVEETDAGIRYQVTLPTPLKTGHKYTVVVDPQTGPQFTDSLGRGYAEARVTMKVAGEKEKPAPAPKKSKKRRR